jgi:hypothetical protein
MQSKSKMVLGIAAASTFGWAAASHAANGDQERWVAAGNEVYPPMLMSSVGGAFGNDNASSSTRAYSDDAFALNVAPASPAADGIYTEYYVVSWTPAASEDADTYVMAIDPESEALLSLNDADYTASTYDVILVPAEFSDSQSTASLSERGGEQGG